MQIAVLDALAQLGCDPSVKDSVSSTPMHVAAGEGHIQAILKLIELVRHTHAVPVCSPFWPLNLQERLHLGCSIRVHTDPATLHTEPDAIK